MFLHFASNFRLWKKSFPLASYYFNNATPHSSHLSHFLFHFFLFFSSSLFYVPSSHHLANSFAVQTSSFSGNNNANYSHYCTSTTHCSTMQIVEYTLSLLYALVTLCAMFPQLANCCHTEIPYARDRTRKWENFFHFFFAGALFLLLVGMTMMVMMIIMKGLVRCRILY